MRKRRTWATCVIVVAVGLSLIVVRRFGVPWEPATPSWPSRIVEVILGTRSRTLYAGGRVACVELRRGRARAAASWVSSVETPLVRADYYDPAGRQRSSVREGTGVELRFFDDGTPRLLSCYVDGIRAGPLIAWHPTGAVRLCLNRNSGGVRDGIESAYDQAGQLLYCRQYVDGQAASAGEPLQAP